MAKEILTDEQKQRNAKELQAIKDAIQFRKVKDFASATKILEGISKDTKYTKMVVKELAVTIKQKEKAEDKPEADSAAKSENTTKNIDTGAMKVKKGRSFVYNRQTYKDGAPLPEVSEKERKRILSKFNNVVERA